MRIRARLPLALSVVIAVMFVAGCGDDDDQPPETATVATGVESPTAGEGTPTVSPQPTPRPIAGKSALHEARLDVAGLTGVDVLDVALAGLAHAGWDGCLGVSGPGSRCADLFIAGYRAEFDAGDQRFRYHFGDRRFIGPVDPATSDPGVAVHLELKVDFGRLMAEYARHEDAVRSSASPEELTIEWIAPMFFENPCLGYRPADRECLEEGPASLGVLIRVVAAGSESLYSGAGAVIFHDPNAGNTTVTPDEEAVRTQQAMREDLATRLGLTLNEVSVVAYREVVWSNGCLGVLVRDAVCTEALVDGFLAHLEAQGQTYRYHGAFKSFTATDFVPDARIVDPIPR